MSIHLHLPQNTLNLFLVRHGETDYNARQIVQGGGIDSDLNETGKQQAEAFYQYYRKTHFQAVYVSKLVRTRQTMQPFERNGYRLREERGFDEMNWGTMEGREASPEVRARFRQILDEWERGNLDHKIEGGESPVEVWRRAEQSLTAIAKRHRSGNVLICSHGRTLRVMLSVLLGYGLERMQLFEHHNTGLYVLSRTGRHHNAFVLNDVSHSK